MTALNALTRLTALAPGHGMILCSGDGRSSEPDPDRRRRPLTVRLATGALGFAGATAIGGGIEMLAFPGGNRFVSTEWLESIPFLTTYRIPGIALAVAVGAPALVAGIGLARRTPTQRPGNLDLRARHHWSRAATQLSGLALLTWLAIEVAVIPDRSAIEAIYTAIALSLMTLPTTPSFRAYTANP